MDNRGVDDDGGRRIYIAGPMRGKPRFNFDAFDRAAARLAAHGYDAINPADMDRSLGLNPERDEATPDFLRKAAHRDAKALVNDADGVALLPGWQQSIGAMRELVLAEMMDLPIYDAETGQRMPRPKLRIVPAAGFLGCALEGGQ